MACQARVLLLGLLVCTILANVAAIGLKWNMSKAISSVFKTKTADEKDLEKNLKKVCKLLLLNEITLKVDTEIMDTCKIKVGILHNAVGLEYIYSATEFFLGLGEHKYEEVIELVYTYRDKGWTIENIDKLKYPVRSNTRARQSVFFNAVKYADPAWWMRLLDMDKRDNFYGDAFEEIVFDHQLRTTLPLYINWKEKAENKEKRCPSASMILVLKFDSKRGGKLVETGLLESFFEIVCQPYIYETEFRWNYFSLDYILLSEWNREFSNLESVEEVKAVLQMADLPYVINMLAHHRTKDELRRSWKLSKIINMIDVINYKRLSVPTLMAGIRGAIGIELHERLFSEAVSRIVQAQRTEENVYEFFHALHATDLTLTWDPLFDEHTLSVLAVVFDLNKRIRELTPQSSTATNELEPLTKDILSACLERQLPIRSITELIQQSSKIEMPEKAILLFLQSVTDIDNDLFMKVHDLLYCLSHATSGAIDLTATLNFVVENKKSMAHFQVNLYTFVEMMNEAGNIEAVKAYFTNGKVLLCEKELMMAIVKYFKRSETPFDAEHYSPEIQHACVDLRGFVSKEKRISYYETEESALEEVKRAYERSSSSND